MIFRLEDTIVKRDRRIFISLLEAMVSFATADVELLTPEEAALKESARKDRIEKAKQELIASLVTSLTPSLSGLTSFVDDTLTTIKKQTIKLTTHNRLIISK